MTINTILKANNSVKLALVLLLSGIFIWFHGEVSETYELQRNFYRVDALISELRITSDAKYRLLRSAVQTPIDGQLEAWEDLLVRTRGGRPRPDTSFLKDETLPVEAIAAEIMDIDDGERAKLQECLDLDRELEQVGKAALMMAHGLAPDRNGRYTEVGEPQLAAAQALIDGHDLEQIPTKIMSIGRKLRERLFADFKVRMDKVRADLANALALAGGVLLILGIFILTSISFFHSRVSAPLARVSRYAEEVAEGKTPAPLRIPHNDELASMYVSLEKMKFALTQRIQATEDARQAAQVSHEQALQAKAEAVKALHRAETMARTQEDFLRRISHEIRTPLNAIIGMSYLCMQTRLDHSQREYLDNINKAGNNLLGMFNKMLDFSSVSDGSLRPEFALFPLQSMLARLRELIAPKAADKGLEFSVDKAGDLPDNVFGDERHLEEVLRILLENALKFTEQGRIALTCELTPTDLIRITVSDTGPGISENALESIFAPYKEGSRAGEDINQGLGLGLSLANSLVTLMGGKLSIESREGEGSRFSFELTYRQDMAATAMQEPPQAVEEQAQAEAPARAPIVLVVDDNEINLMIDAELLEQVGITPVLVNNGQEAVDYMKDNEADLVLMDMQMPVMDGIEATKRIREMGFGKEALPILAMTAHTDEGSRQEGQQAGMNDYLTKPIDPQHLYDRLAHWLPGARLDIPAAPGENAEVQQAQKRVSDAAAAVGGYVDYEAGLKTLGSNERLYHDLLQAFVANYGDSADRLERMLAEGDRDAAKRLVHTLKGTTGNLRMTPLRSIIIAIEESLSTDGPDAEHLAGFAETLRATLDAIGQLMQEGDHVELRAGTAGLPEETARTLLPMLRELPHRVERDWGTTQENLLGLAPQLNGTVHAEAFAKVLTAVNSFDTPAIQKASWELAEQLQRAAA